MHTEWTFSSVNLRDFDTVLIFFSEEEIEELQAATGKTARRCWSNRFIHLTSGEKNSQKSVCRIIEADRDLARRSL